MFNILLMKQRIFKMGIHHLLIFSLSINKYYFVINPIINSYKITVFLFEVSLLDEPSNS